MKAYLSVFRIRFSTTIQYRAAALAGVVTQFFWGLLEILAFMAIYKGNDNIFQMTLSEVVSYTWLKEAFLVLITTWFYDRDIQDTIRSGNISYELSRPLDLYFRWFSLSGANRIARSVLRSIPILAIAFFLPDPLRLSLPPAPVNAVGFFVTMALGLGVVLAFNMIVYGLTLYTLSPSGLLIIFAMISDFLSGSIIPIPFFPESIRKIAEVLPFGSMMNLPFRVYSGNITGTYIISGILLQCFWLVTLILIGRLIMKRALKKVIIQGG